MRFARGVICQPINRTFEFFSKIARQCSGVSPAPHARMTDSQDIRHRTFAFACAVARLALRLPPRPGVRCIIDQLLRSATAVGANLEEAKAGSTTREFIRIMEIALREAREATYRWRICGALELAPSDALKELSGEGDQISRILASMSSRRSRDCGSVMQYLHFAF